MKSEQVKNIWDEGTIKKRNQFYEEIQSIPDERLRSNLTHSFYKLISFMETDVQQKCLLKDSGYDSDSIS